ncbi:glycosyltransferase [Nocardioides sp. W7]|uniref:glycosyltransferase family 2 protein n=1 Tax=Nocardioides sp. W7 TaxID=2931390 RepID=UPI001FD22E84|nr:glycosyltransferase [Nocardioides sp. W7]
MPQLVVAMPVRNGGHHLRRALRSTLRALPADAQLVVCDDGSSDSTPQSLGAFADSRLVILRNERSMGVSATLNRIIDETDSQYVARMDADDVCFPWRFRLQLRQAQGAAAVFSSVVLMRGMLFKPQAPIRLSTDVLRVSLLMSNPLSHPTAFLTRAAVETVGGYRDTPAEDYDLWLRLLAHGYKVERFAPPTIAYRIHDGQVTRSPEWMAKREQDAILRESYEEEAGENAPWFAQLRRSQITSECDQGGMERLLQIVGERGSSLSIAERTFLRWQTDRVL